MSKRGDNIWRRRDGRWCARYVKKRENGKAIYGYLYGKTYSEVKAKREDVWKNAIEVNIQTDEMKDFAYFADGFLKHREALVKRSTLERYRGILKTRILPFFAHLPPKSVTSELLEEYIERLRLDGKQNGEGGLCEKSIRDTVQILFSVLEYAAERGCPSAVTRRITLPKPSKKPIEILTSSDQATLEKYIFENMNAETLGILIALYTGLRIGEICALRWQDIDLSSGVLSVAATIQRIPVDSVSEKTKLISDKPKSDASQRSIPLSYFLAEQLFLFRNEPSVYLLTNSTKPTEPRVYYRKYQRLLKACGLPGYTFHALRHTFATRAVEKGFDSKALSELLGHTSVKLTLERYVHPSVEMKRIYMEKMTPLLSNLLSSG